jgi:hypothetical protein
MPNGKLARCGTTALGQSDDSGPVSKNTGPDVFVTVAAFAGVIGLRPGTYAWKG